MGFVRQAIALAVAVWTAFAVIYTSQVPGALAWGGLMPVMPITLIAAAAMALVSLTKPLSPRRWRGIVETPRGAPQTRFKSPEVLDPHQITGDHGGAGDERRLAVSRHAQPR